MSLLTNERLEVYRLNTNSVRMLNKFMLYEAVRTNNFSVLHYSIVYTLLQVFFGGRFARLKTSLPVRAERRATMTRRSGRWRILRVGCAPRRRRPVEGNVRDMGLHDCQNWCGTTSTVAVLYEVCEIVEIGHQRAVHPCRSDCHCD